MEQEPDTDNTQLRNKQKQKIGPDCRVGVERVKVNTAAFWVIHWRCQEVVKVNQHCQHHYEPGVQPDFFIRQAGYQARDKDMQNKME